MSSCLSLGCPKTDPEVKLGADNVLRDDPRKHKRGTEMNEPVRSALMSELSLWAIGSVPLGTLSCPAEEQGSQGLFIYGFLSQPLVESCP